MRLTWVYFSYSPNAVMLVNLEKEAEYRELWDDEAEVHAREYL